MFEGCYTAIVTPMKDHAVDIEGLRKLVEFQIAAGIDGVLGVGTTGESPTLTWEEHNKVIEVVVETCKGKCQSIAGTGSNNTRETMESTEHAVHLGADGALLVDPYYNGPSSLEIRREYAAPIAAAFPDLDIIPYVIPGRTGAQLLPEDLALLFKSHPNVSTVKEATGNLDEVQIRDIKDAYEEYIEIEKRRAFILDAISPTISLSIPETFILFTPSTPREIPGIGVISTG